MKTFQSTAEKSDAHSLISTGIELPGGAAVTRLVMWQVSDFIIVLKCFWMLEAKLFLGEVCQQNSPHGNL